MIRYNRLTKTYEDEETNLASSSKTRLRANIKRSKLNIPLNCFLSNKFVLKNIEIGEVV